MKLTNNEINRMAAELLGDSSACVCGHSQAVHLRVCEGCVRDRPSSSSPVCGGYFQFKQDFIHDANAVRELVVWFVKTSGPAQECHFNDFLEDEEGPDVFSKLYALAAPPKHITLAVLYAVGKITLEQAREAMEGDDDE